jgi:hypothetical protein
MSKVIYTRTGRYIIHQQVGVGIKIYIVSRKCWTHEQMTDLVEERITRNRPSTSRTTC